MKNLPKGSKMRTMNTKLIHSVIFLLLLAMTAHEAHAAVSHDVEACEVCIHLQSNDDALADTSVAYLAYDIALHQKVVNHSSITANIALHSSDLIRGPPLYTL